MPGKRIIFIPRTKLEAQARDTGNGPDLYAQATSWEPVVSEKGKAFRVFCTDDAFDVELDAEDTVYIYGGHGISNRDSVTWPGNDAHPLDSATVAGLAQVVIPSTFAGKIKVYSCHSGETGGTAFAARVADAMRLAGYNSCTFFGYLGEISQRYEILKSFQRFPYSERTGQDAPTTAKRFSHSGSGVTRMKQGLASAFRIVV
jgi:hypothetical protein